MEEMPDAQVGEPVLVTQHLSGGIKAVFKGIITGKFPKKFSKGQYNVKVLEMVYPIEIGVVKVMKLK